MEVELPSYLGQAAERFLCQSLGMSILIKDKCETRAGNPMGTRVAGNWEQPLHINHRDSTAVLISAVTKFVTLLLPQLFISTESMNGFSFSEAFWELKAPGPLRSQGCHFSWTSALVRVWILPARFSCPGSRTEDCTSLANSIFFCGYRVSHSEMPMTRAKQGSETKTAVAEHHAMTISVRPRKKRHPCARSCENTCLATKWRRKTFWHMLETTLSIMTAVVVISNYFINNSMSFCPVCYFLATLCYLRGGPYSSAFYCRLAESQNSEKPSMSDCSSWCDEMHSLQWHCTHGVFL